MVGSPHEALHQICQKDTEGMIRSFRRLFHAPFPEPRSISVVNSRRAAEARRRADSDRSADASALAPTALVIRPGRPQPWGTTATGQRT
ncbi:hypothetical protein IQ62_46220 [Streptomyces scabiei]|nr:hypothetical protein IQ62_46220 [Streptomyces scabiei]